MAVPPSPSAPLIPDGASGIARMEEFVEQIRDSHTSLYDTLTTSGATIDWRALLIGTMTGSPFLARLIEHHPQIVAEIVAKGADGATGIINNLLADLAEMPPASSQDELMATLRQAKQKAALTIALADLAGLWSLQSITTSLTQLADSSVQAAVRWLAIKAAEKGEISLPDGADPAETCGLIVLAMGKMGAFELNYSSDIDLIVLFDSENTPYQGRKTPSEFYVRMTRDLVKIMQERTADGYVFRTDLRLRPDAGMTPIALPMFAAESYYESTGQNWERAAMIKARPVAGCLELGKQFVEHISPFVWRKALDYAAIDDVHAITRQIRAQQKSGPFSIEGHDVKLGRGGIREIEFFVQTEQMIAGGRDRRLRVPPTLDVLERLVDTGHIDEMARKGLSDAYIFLRNVEHRLQMVNDEQTQAIPTQQEALDRLIAFMGYQSLEAFETAFTYHFETVKSAYDHLFSIAEQAEEEDESEKNELEAIRKLGYRNPEAIYETLARWQSGRYRALKAERSRTLARMVRMDIVKAFAKAPDPDLAFSRFDQFLFQLPAGVQLFSLIRANPWLLSQIAGIMGMAPNLARMLERKPSLLDVFIDPEGDAHLESSASAHADLRFILEGARDYEAVLDAARRWANDHKFLVGSRLLAGSIDAYEAGRRYSYIAEAVIDLLRPATEEEFAQQHGRIEGGQFAILAVGKLGEQQMTLTSDTDLIFVYDYPDNATESDGRRKLTPSHYYGRLAQRMINALSALTAEGSLYEVDMRMRPQGQKGPIASRLQGFRTYYSENAWTYEYQALMKARLISAPEDFGKQVMQVVQDSLCQPRDFDIVAGDIAAMRKRMADHFRESNRFSVKQVRGGMVDLEFLVQAFCLAHAKDQPELIGVAAEEAIKALAEAGNMPDSLAAQLEPAARLMRTIQAVLRTAIDTRFEGEEAPEILKQQLAQSCGYENFSALGEALEETQDMVLHQFESLLGTHIHNRATGTDQLED